MNVSSAIDIGTKITWRHGCCFFSFSFELGNKIRALLEVASWLATDVKRAITLFTSGQYFDLCTFAYIQVHAWINMTVVQNLQRTTTVLTTKL